jgi:5,10-methylenetetrahydromethanopterin reductase
VKAGVAVWLDRPIADCAEVAAAAEAAGFSDIWVPDHYFLRDAFAAQALMAQRTSRVRLGTAVASPLLRHPALLASAAATIQELSRGRAVLGLGVGGFEFAAHLGIAVDRPVSLLREAVRVVRALLGSGPGEVRGDHFTAVGPGLGWSVDLVPVYLAARGPRMLELAGEVADGVITHGLAPSYVRFCLERIRSGAERTGRAPGACELVLMFDVEVDHDVDAAIDRLRPRVAFMAGGSYAEDLIPVLGLARAEVMALRAALRGGAPDAPRLVTDAMVRAFTVAGPPEHVAERLAELAEAGVDRVILSVGGTTLSEVIRSVERVGRAVTEALPEGGARKGGTA